MTGKQQRVQRPGVEMTWLSTYAAEWPGTVGFTPRLLPHFSSDCDKETHLLKPWIKSRAGAGAKQSEH